MRGSTASVLVLAALTPLASAGFISISPIAGGLMLQSGTLAPTVFGTAEPAWTNASLASAHAALNAAGIATDGKITIVPADTDHGLALLILIDRQGTPGTPTVMGSIALDTIAGSGNLAFINDSAGPLSLTTGAGGSRLASATLNWNSNGEGDAFAWANLALGDVSTYHFQQMASSIGLDSTDTFQFVTWSTDHWALVPITGEQASFTATGEFGLAAQVIPAPASLIPLLALGFRRRRA